MNPKLESFQRLSLEDLAAQVRAAGPHVCTLSLLGARRARFTLSSGRAQASAPLAPSSFAHTAFYRLIFDHGIDTLLVPLGRRNLLERATAAEELSALATRPDFLEFYEHYQVRVRFYGEYRPVLAGSPHAYLIDQFDRLADRTRRYNRHRLFFGLFASDASETLAGLSVRHYQQHGHMPDRAALTTLYYGEYIEPISLVLALDPYNAADTPLLANGSEEFYIIHGGLAGLTQRQLRRVLYDQLYNREEKPAEPAQIGAEESDWLHDFNTEVSSLWTPQFEGENAWPAD